MRRQEAAAIIRQAQHMVREAVDMSMMAEPANLDLMHHAFDHVYEHFANPQTAMHFQDAGEMLEDGKEAYHHLKTKWTNQAAAAGQNFAKKFQAQPSPSQYAQHAHSFLQFENPNAKCVYDSTPGYSCKFTGTEA